MSAVAHLHPAEATLTKKQLAQHLGRSERWVELRTKEGMPSLPPSRRFASRRFILAEVQSWLTDGRSTKRTTAERVRELERQVGRLGDRIARLEGKPR